MSFFARTTRFAATFRSGLADLTAKRRSRKRAARRALPDGRRGRSRGFLAQPRKSLKSLIKALSRLERPVDVEAVYVEQ
jgi:hypothetical protein